MGTSTGCAIRSSHLLSKRAVFHPTCVRASLILFKQGLGACDGDGPIATGPQHLNGHTLHRVPATPHPRIIILEAALPSPSDRNHTGPLGNSPSVLTDEGLIEDGGFNLADIC